MGGERSGRPRERAVRSASFRATDPTRSGSPAKPSLKQRVAAPGRPLTGGAIEHGQLLVLEGARTLLIACGIGQGVVVDGGAVLLRLLQLVSERLWREGAIREVPWIRVRHYLPSTTAEIFGPVTRGALFAGNFMHPAGLWSKGDLIIDFEALKVSPNGQFIPMFRVERISVAERLSQFLAGASAVEDQTALQLAEAEAESAPLCGGEPFAEQDRWPDEPRRVVERVGADATMPDTVPPFRDWPGVPPPKFPCAVPHPSPCGLRPRGLGDADSWPSDGGPMNFIEQGIPQISPPAMPIQRDTMQEHRIFDAGGLVGRPRFGCEAHRSAREHSSSPTRYEEGVRRLAQGRCVERYGQREWDSV